MNTLVWGFSDNYQEIIDRLTDNKIIDLKLWFVYNILLPTDYRSNQYEISSFLNLDDFLERYEDKFRNYVEDLKYDYTVYNEVYKYFFYYINIESRQERHYIKPMCYYINKFNLIFKFVYAVLTKEKIKLCIFQNLAHEGFDVMIYLVAKFLNIKTIFLFQSAIPNEYYKIFYLDNIDDFGNFSIMKKIYDNTQHKIIQTTTKDLWYMNETRSEYSKFDIYSYLYNLYKIYVEKCKKPDPDPNLQPRIDSRSFGQKVIDKIRGKVICEQQEQQEQQKTYLEEYNSLTEMPDYNCKYVCFFLHLQPELTTSVLGEIYCDQILALERLSEIVPKDCTIYVKENPKQTELHRGDFFLKRLKLLENVKLVSTKENSQKLIENSDFVVTITGTVGWEALCQAKPALIFGNAWYQNFEGCFKYNDDIKYEDIANYNINKDKLEKDYNNLLSKMPKAVIDSAFINAVEDYNEEESFNNIYNLIEYLIEDYKCQGEEYIKNEIK